MSLIPVFVGSGMALAQREGLGVLAPLDTAICAIDRDKFVLWRNESFAAELEQGQIVCLDSDGRLELSKDFSADLIDRHIRRVNEMGRAATPLFRERKFFGSLWMVADGSEDSRSMLVIVRRARVDQSLIGILQDMFNLGKREAEVAWHIANGDEVKDISEKMGISIATARVHLRQIFVKTDTNKQSSLVALIHSIAVPI